MKEKINQLFRDKLILVMLVLGLLTMVAAAGAVKIRKGTPKDGQNPYSEVPEQGGILAENSPQNKTEAIQNETTKESEVQKAGSSDASYSKENKAVKKEKKQETEEKAKKAGAGNDAAKAMVLNFNNTSKLAWPVTGNIILDYSMESTIYFPTLDQYKCNPAVVIQSEVSSPVTAPADAKVAGVGSNEEIGNYVLLDLGNEYTAVCGQLKDIQVSKEEYIAKGTILGYVSEPTKYYSIEGNNVFFELKHQNSPIDALDYLE